MTGNTKPIAEMSLVKAQGVITRPELAERGLDDALEKLYHDIEGMGESEKIGVLGVSCEAEGQAFELRCRVCASFATEGHLKSFIRAYNTRAKRELWKTIEYSYAAKLSRVGKRFVEAGKRMTRDYPMLTPVFFTEALDAGDEFFKALDYAEDKAEAHEKAPDTEPKLTQREFRSVIYEKPPAASRTLDDRRRSSTSGSQTGSGEDPSPAGEPNPQPPFSEPQAPEPDNSSTDIDAEAEPQTVESALERARELAEEEGIDLQEAVTHAFGIELGSEEEASTDGPESPDDQAKPDELTCFECSGCRMLKADQRLAVVKPSGEVLMQFEPTAVWACGRHNRVISVRAQNFVHARAIAAACPDLDPVSAGEQQTAAEDDNLAASEESVSLDDVMAAQEAIVS